MVYQTRKQIKSVDVEFFVAYSRTKGKDLSKALDLISNRVNAHTEMVNTWADIWLQHAHEKNGFKKIVKACTKVNKARAKVEVKRVKDQAKAEAKAKPKAKAKAKAIIVKLIKQVSTTEPLPTPSNTISYLDQLSQKMEQELK